MSIYSPDQLLTGIGSSCSWAFNCFKVIYFTISLNIKKIMMVIIVNTSGKASVIFGLHIHCPNTNYFEYS